VTRVGGESPSPILLWNSLVSLLMAYWLLFDGVGC
jgi:hypothetical protein